MKPFKAHDILRIRNKKYLSVTATISDPVPVSKGDVKSIEFEKERYFDCRMNVLLKLAETNPYPVWEIRPIYIECHKLYYPHEKSVGKCLDIITLASSENISLRESLKRQIEIDFS